MHALPVRICIDVFVFVVTSEYRWADVLVHDCSEGTTWLYKLMERMRVGNAELPEIKMLDVCDAPRLWTPCLHADV